MDTLASAQRDRIDGRAVFAATAFVASVGVIAALERVGAPDGLVEGLGPLFAFAASSVIGLTNRSAGLADFLAVRRAVRHLRRPRLGRDARRNRPGARLWRGEPRRDAMAADRRRRRLCRMRGGARHPRRQPEFGDRRVGDTVPRLSGAGDVRRRAVRLRRAGGIGGLRLATQSLARALDSNTGAAALFVACAMVCTLIPGGMKSALWTDAASGGGALLIALFGAAFAIVLLPAPIAPLGAVVGRLSAQASALGGDPAPWMALAVGLACYFPLMSAAAATPSRRNSLRAGIYGFGFALLGFAASALAMPMLAAVPASAVHTGQSLVSEAAWLPSLALARAGVLAASRAAGIDLAHAYTRLSVLSSRRIASGRLMMLAAIALCPFTLQRLGLSPERALMFSLAISLAFLAPSLILALVLDARAGSASALVALLATGAMLAIQALRDPRASWTCRFSRHRCWPGVAGLAAGALAALVFPKRAGGSDLPPGDPFVDPADLG